MSWSNLQARVLWCIATDRFPRTDWTWALETSWRSLMNLTPRCGPHRTSIRLTKYCRSSTPASRLRLADSGCSDSGFWRYHNHLLFSSSGLVVVSGSGAIRSPPIVLLELPEFQTLDVATLKDAADLFEYDDALDATSRNTGRFAQSGSCLKAQRL